MGKAIAIGAAGPGVLLCLLLFGCDGGDGPAPRLAAPPSVTVAAVSETEIVDSVTFIGRVKAVDSVEVRARVEGFLQERRFTEGQDVEAGTPIFLIEPDSFEADLALARAKLAQAEARLDEADKNLERSRALIKRGNVSEAKLDSDVAAQQAASAEVQAQKAQVRLAEIALGYTEIAAPIAGRTGEAAYSTGDLVGPQSEPLVAITALDPIQVTFNVSERDYVAVRRRRLAEQGQGSEITDPRMVPTLRLPDGSDYGQPGRIDYIDDRVNPATGTLSVRAVFPNQDRLLVPGQFVTVVLSGREPERRLVVPQVAVQQDQRGRFVLLVDADKRVQQRPVTLGDQSGVNWVVEEGLSAGDLVVIEGLQKIRPGVAVEPLVAQPAGEG